MPLIYTIVLAILSSFSYIVAGTLFVGILILAIRNDLVSAAIDRELLRQKPVVVTLVDADEEDDYWMNSVKRMAFEPVPPAVRIQMFIDLLQKLNGDRLDPMDKRLKAVTVRMTKMMATIRRARMAYDFESLEMTALCASNTRQTMSIGTSTVDSDNLAVSKSSAVKEENESLKKVSIVEQSTQSLSKKSLSQKSLSKKSSSKKSLQTHSVEQTQSGSISASSTSEVPPTDPESLTEKLKELSSSLISVVIWFKNALTSNVYRKKAVAVYRAINSILDSQYLKICFKFIFDSFDKTVKLYAHIDMNDDEMTSVMIRIPATENDGQ